MIDISSLNKYDPSGMHKIYDRWPELARKSYETDHVTIDFKNIDNIIFSGMGGSGAIGDVLESIFSQTKIHVSTVKGYVLPKTVDSNSLIIIISVSGNTDETLSILKQANDIGCKIISISSGGIIEKFSQENNIVHFKSKLYHSPRVSFISFLYVILNFLLPILPLDQKDIDESLIELENMSKLINSTNLVPENPSLFLAESIHGIPLIYSPSGLRSAAIRFKNSIQDNVKSHVIIEDIIESCHNGIESWERKSEVVPIFIMGQDDHFKTKERWRILKEYLSHKDIDYNEIVSIKGNILSKLVTLIYLLDYASIYMAILSKVDPSPINAINFIKSYLNSTNSST